MTTAILTEKPSVARDIARVLGAHQRRNGFLDGNGYRVTWALGHLVELPQPHQIDARWKRWSEASLPMIPRRWPLSISAKTKDQFEIVRSVLTAPDVDLVVCATDAGREGELIFRYIVEAAGCTKPLRRLWISSLTAAAIEQGFARLEDATEFAALADAARGRSRADWIVGMNLTRAYTLAERTSSRSSAAASEPGKRPSRDVLSVGRVQTPTLAMLVEREREIRSFVPEDYLEVEVCFGVPASPELESDEYRGLYFRDVPALEGEEAAARAARARRLPPDGEAADAIVARALSGVAEIASIDAQRRSLPPPQLYDLTELQRHANRLYGFSAKRTLELAQTLYERYKLLSYPRTDSRHLSAAVAETLPEIVAAIRVPYESKLTPETGTAPLSRRFVDDARITDHHAIIPTGVALPRSGLPEDAAKIYTLVCVRLLAAWQPDYLYSTTVVITEIKSTTGPSEAVLVDHYRSSGTRVDQLGWRSLEREHLRPGDSQTSQATPELPTDLREGLQPEVRDAHSVPRKTQPPRPFTEATLLTAMETAGRSVDDRELSEAMRERGLGTPATRAGIIETLLQRDYVERRQKSLRATDKGMHLVEIVDPDVKSPALTGRFEFQLSQIERGNARLDSFMGEIETFVRSVLARIVGVPTRAPAVSAPAQGTAFSTSAQDAPRPSKRERVRSQPVERSAPPNVTSPAPRPIPAAFRRSLPAARSRSPTSSECLQDLLRDTFGFASFRPFQERVCRAVTDGQDALLVMPTGAGKSLCYQLPGIARAGTTLVLSPLIALMDDQVAALNERGLHAESIHSGRDRQHSRRVCQEYLAGSLDFLFVAPERLRVAGFPQMLARSKPSLIAVDEAHCISQWGHDFRPDYRMLGEHLERLRPTPVLAVTATATPTVQKDIVEQLRLQAPALFVHGFRRTNLGIEVVELPPRLRAPAVREIMSDPTNRPAIVYAASRKQAEELAELLAAVCNARVYHAGMTAERRQSVHNAFRSGELEVVVATIAFGMGIDKADIRTVIHTARPRSIENYYQEIGRAGRDGANARAVMLQSFADQRLHEWFLDRDYPAESTVASVYAKLRDAPQSVETLQGSTRLEPEELQRIVEKLWIHGGAVVDPEDRLIRGPSDWRAAYRSQRAQRELEIERVREYVSIHTCRMAAIVQHFGDSSDRQASCGLCDMCAPSQCLYLESRPLGAAGSHALDYVTRALREKDGMTVGQLHSGLPRASIDRRAFEDLLATGVRAGLFRELADEFERHGEKIRFRRLYLCDDASRSRPHEVSEFVPRTPTSAPTPRTTNRSRTRKSLSARRAGSPSGAAPSSSAPAEARPSLSDASARCFELLKDWRRTEARHRRKPAFRILTDQALHQIATVRPTSEEQLLAVRGVGASTVSRHGAAILRIVFQTRG